MSGASPARRVAGAALIATLGGLALAGALAIAAGRDGWTLARAAIAVAAIAAAWWRPLPAACALVALAPLFGNRPTTPQFVWLIWLTALAVPAWLARLATTDRAIAARVLGAPVGLATLAYVGASVLSLSSLPLYALPEIVGATTIGGAIAAAPRALVTADVIAPAYPVLSVVLTLHAALAALTIAVGIARPADDDARVAPAALAAGAVAVGCVLAVGIGLLDFVALVDLRRLRAFDPFTNASGAERMQSTFGHAGWLAEYVCFTTPALLVVWLSRLRLSTAWRAAATAGLLAASLVVIVLSYQRGGWITWLVVGPGVALAALRWSGAVAGAGGAGAGTGFRAPRLALAGLAAIVVALVLGLGVVRVAGGSGAMARFAERARLITQVSDRQAHVMTGLRLGALLPVLGGGSESFAIRYREEYLLSGGEYYARGYSPLMQMYGSAHNVFAQTFAGKGAAGLLALVILLLTAASSAWRVSRDAARPADVRVVATIALGMLGAFALYGLVQEVFYIQALQLTVFAGIGLAAALAPPEPAAATARRFGLVAVLLLIVLSAHVAHAWISPGRLAEGYHDREISRAGARLGAPEPDGEGGHFQWAGGAAFVTVPRQATALSFDLRSLGPEPQMVEVRLDDRLVDRVRLDTHAWRHVEYPLGKLRELPRRLHLAVQPTWREPGGTREFGVGVRRLRWAPTD